MGKLEGKNGYQHMRYILMSMTASMAKLVFTKSGN